MDIKIDKESSVKCPWCSRVSSAEIWNDNTLSECRSREMRRAFKSIYTTQVWGKTSQNFYKCPSCNSWSRGNELVLLDEHGEIVKGLGGVQVLRLIDQEGN